jgi:ABC-type Na+ efflux pump permease subunit
LEYLLSFPLSKFKIVLIKLIPRFAILFLLILANLVVDFVFLDQRFRGDDSGFYFMTVLSLFFLVMFFLLTGFFVSMFFEKKKLRIYVTLAALISLVTVSLGIHSLLMSSSLIRHLYDISFLTGSVVVLLPMVIAFVSVYRKFDLKAARVHGRRFVLRALPPLAVLTAAGLFVFFKYGV